MPTKYLIAARVPAPACTQVDSIARKVAHMTNRQTEHNRTRLPWHVTFLPPQIDIDPTELSYAVKHVVLDAPRARLTLGRPTAFGKDYIILPAHTSLGAARLWCALHDAVRRLPGFYAGRYLLENTLHVTLVKGLSEGFDAAWPRLERLVTKDIPFDLMSLSVFEKTDKGPWSETLKCLYIP